VSSGKNRRGNVKRGVGKRFMTKRGMFRSLPVRAGDKKKVVTRGRVEGRKTYEKLMTRKNR